MPAALPPSSPSPLDAVAADAAVAQAADSTGHAHGPVHSHCENCGTKLEGPFCHRCGQHDFDVHRSFGHVFLEVLENLFHFDGKFFRNIVTLLFSPGRLTAAFNAGQRAAQVPPFRLYIFTAFFFFLWIFSTTKTPDAVKIGGAPAPGVNAGLTVDGQPVTVEQALKARNDPVFAEQLKKELAAELARRGATAEQVEQVKSAGLAAPASKAAANRPQLSVTPFGKPREQMNDTERWLEHQAQRAMQPETQRELGRAFLAAMPKMLLFCLPFFALYTRVLFRKSGEFYLQHLILALHFHTFIFLWLMFRDGWAFTLSPLGFGLSGWVTFAANAWLALYPLLMLRQLFANSWLKTFAKTLLLALAYVATLGAAFFITGLIIFLLL